MTKLLIGLASLPFIASVALAGQPVALSDTQMDKVTAGYTTAIIPADGILNTNVLITTGSTTTTFHLSYPAAPIFLIGPGF